MIWLIGAGRMAQSYSSVLKELDRDHLVIGRGTESAAAFTAQSGVECRPGGLDAALEALPPPIAAILAVDVDQLAPATMRLLEAGCKNILVEKPGGIDAEQIDAVAKLAESCGADVSVAYNRRFYGSVLAAQRLLAEDGGPLSVSFEFTELSDVIAKLPHHPAVKDNWLLANSTHVIDTAFFLGGDPKHMFPLTAGGLDWHPRAARFAGAGVTDKGALFSYFADWDAPGRWGIDVNSQERRFVLRPMEQLQVQIRGEFAIVPVAEDDDLDKRFKPGLYRQTKAFLEKNQSENLLSMKSHAHRVKTIYDPMYNSLLKLEG